MGSGQVPVPQVFNYVRPTRMQLINLTWADNNRTELAAVCLYVGTFSDIWTDALGVKEMRTRFWVFRSMDVKNCRFHNK